MARWKYRFAPFLAGIASLFGVYTPPPPQQVAQVAPMPRPVDGRRPEDHRRRLRREDNGAPEPDGEEAEYSEEMERG